MPTRRVTKDLVLPASASPRPSRRARPFRQLAGGTLILLAMFALCFEGWAEWQSRDARIREVQASAGNLARALLRDLEEDIARADAAAAGIASQLAEIGTGPAALAETGRLIRRSTLEHPRLRNLSVYGPDGMLLVTSLRGTETGISISDLDYFRAHREDAELGSKLGTATRSRLDGQWVVTISHRFDEGSGRFGGVVVAALDGASLTRALSGFAIGGSGAVALLRTDGRLIARFPNDEAMLGSPILGRTAFRERLHQGRSGTFRYLSPVDGLERIGAYETGQRYPLALSVGYGLDEALAGWTHRAILRGLSVLVLATLLLLLGAAWLRQAQLRRHAEIVLAAEEEHARLVSEHVTELILRLGPDGRVHQASAASLRLLGLPPRALKGRVLEGLVEPEDRPAFRAAWETAIGPASRADALARMPRPDGSYRWIEFSFRRLEAEGSPGAWLAIARDVTERKALDDRMAALAATDGLTGLPNSRRFHEALDIEWNRSAREGCAMAVLLLDLDRFRRFNESCGNLAGDDALRLVAATLDLTIRRPADLAARHGGDSFAILLPATDGPGAREVAERVRMAVAAAAIPHSASESGRITASLGLAAVQPMPATLPDSSMLLGAAEAALHEAKRMGGDRVVEAPSITVIQSRRAARP
ncbi:diguanylate cyclase [Roseomonas sp. SSH11]|uniref:diguanylate cyclase n=1 Tax=Pararoseomonas baculiformis TaxID=2820812 RepID=A0ABS4AEL9_9PROT|nr:diguanylate cyclase [Pararoseomonas baculiformis]MBP0445468.1 diguanylate cyclase [Pararoseomonas baculiformis]